MRFSTIFATLTLLIATVSACKSDLDCPRGQMCKFKGIKDSRGQCYKRGEGPPTPVLAGKKHRRAYPIDYDELVTREVDDYDWN